MVEAALLSVATAWIAFTVSESVVFAPLRAWIEGRSVWFGKLVSCGYCLSFWIALGLVAIYQPRLFESWPPLDYLLTALVISWVAAFQWAILCVLLDIAGK